MRMHYNADNRQFIWYRLEQSHINVNQEGNLASSKLKILHRYEYTVLKLVELKLFGGSFCIKMYLLSLTDNGMDKLPTSCAIIIRTPHSYGHFHVFPWRPN